MSRRASTAVRRGPVLAVLAAALVAGGLADRAGAPRMSPAAERSATFPAMAPADALSSSWFCAGATDGGSPDAPGRVVIANDGARSASGVVTVVPTRGKRVRVPVKVAPYKSVSVPETVPGGSPWVAAIVDVDAGSVAVEQVLGGGGMSVSPCATAGSARWYFATGQTRINAGTAIELLNPYPSDSIVDLSFTTDQGNEQPQAFEGIDVPAGGLVSVDLGSHLRRRSSIATTVKARTGRVVAWETEWVTPPQPGQAVVGTPAAASPLADPAAPVAGVSSVLGAPAPGTSWTWPDGLAGNGIDERYVIYNPGPDTAEVRLSVGLQQGSAEPFEISVGPYQVVPVVSEHEARIPAGVAHWATLSSTNGVGVVATRAVTYDEASMPGGATLNGIARIPGAPASASSWVVAAPSTGPHAAGSVVVQNPSGRPVRFTLGGLDGAQAASATVGPEDRAALAVPTEIHGALLVTATSDVYVEYDLYGIGGAGGVSASLAVPASAPAATGPAGPR